MILLFWQFPPFSEPFPKNGHTRLFLDPPLVGILAETWQPTRHTGGRKWVVISRRNGGHKLKMGGFFCTQKTWEDERGGGGWSLYFIILHISDGYFMSRWKTSSTSLHPALHTSLDARDSSIIIPKWNSQILIVILTQFLLDAVTLSQI